MHVSSSNRAPVLAAFLADQLDKAAARHRINHLPAVTAVGLWLQDHPAVTFRLGRRDQVEHQLLRAAVAAELQGGGTVVIVEQQAGVQLEADGVIFPLQDWLMPLPTS